MSVPQMLFLYPKPPQDAWLASRHDEGVFRASAVAIAGDFGALAFLPYVGEVPQQKRMSATSTRSSTTDAGLIWPPPVEIPLLPIFGQPAHIPPDLHVIFLFLQVQLGDVRATAEAIAENGDDRIAVAVALGGGDFNVVVELVGGEHDEVLTRALAVVDRPTVASFRSLHTNAGLTRGFGTDSELGIPSH